MNGPLARLMWKDFRLLRPVILLFLGFTVGLNLLSLLMEPEAKSGFAIAIAFSLPFLLVIGIPPLMITTEQDSRAIHWLKSMPVSWRSLLASRMIVGILVANLLAAICFWVTALFERSLVSAVSNQNRDPWDALIASTVAEHY